MNRWIKQWNTISILKKGFQEHIKCAREVYSLADEILRCDDSVEECYRVSMGNVPEELFTLKRNLFSIIFQSVYQLLGISDERRHLYGQINHLNRIWVTSADNMLDNDHNITLPIAMGGESLVMSNVVAIMTADRILSSILTNSVEDGDLTPQQAKKLSLGTLQALFYCLVPHRRLPKKLEWKIVRHQMWCLTQFIAIRQEYFFIFLLLDQLLLKMAVTGMTERQRE